MTTDFANYTQVLTDMKNAVTAAALGFKTVFKNAGDADFTFDNMPLCDFRMKRAVPEALAGGQYYVTLIVEAEIACFDMTSRDKCVTIRDNLTNALQRFFQDHPRFSGYVDSTIVGDAEFEDGESKGQGEFVAATVAVFNISFYAG